MLTVSLAASGALTTHQHRVCILQPLRGGGERRISCWKRHVPMERGQDRVGGGGRGGWTDVMALYNYWVLEY